MFDLLPLLKKKLLKVSTIVFEQVSHSYQGTPALSEINLRLSEERIGIAGLNGSGKSTLIRMINGLLTPTKGKVYVNDMNVAKNGKKVREQVGFIFSQPTNQIIMPTVIEDVAFSLRKHIKKKIAREAEALKYLKRYGLADYADHSPYSLSGGQQQLLAITSVMATNPQIVIADEPTGLLDLRNALRIRQLFMKLPAQMIIVSHDFELLGDMDRVIVLDDGAVVADGAPGEAIDFYKRLATQ